MPSFFFQVNQYLHYLKQSKNAHGIHSPFVFDLYQKAIKPGKVGLNYDAVETRRSELLTSSDRIPIVELGGGSRISTGATKPLKHIIKQSGKSPRLGRLLHRLADYFQPEYILEIGTSAGISTLYQATALNNCLMFNTLEGNPHLVEVAKKSLEALNLSDKVHVVEGNFDQTLSEVLKEYPRLDYILFDGNHRKEPTLSYFEHCLPLAGNDVLMVFDDIHWSAEMHEAWQEIKAHPKVTLTIDLFYLGLVFVREEQQEKEHFTLRF